MDMATGTSSAGEWMCNPVSACLLVSVICSSEKISAHRTGPKISTAGFGHSTAATRDYKFPRRLMLAQTSVSSGYPVPNANCAVF